MIYDDVRSTFDSVAGTFEALDRSLDDLSVTVGRAGLLTESGKLLGLSGLAATEAVTARANSADVDNRGPLNVLVAFAQIQVSDQQTRLRTTLRAPFDTTVAFVPESGDLARSRQLLDSRPSSCSATPGRPREGRSINPEGPFRTTSAGAAYDGRRHRGVPGAHLRHRRLRVQRRRQLRRRHRHRWASGAPSTQWSGRVLVRLPKYTDRPVAFTAALGAIPPRSGRRWATR